MKLAPSLVKHLQDGPLLMSGDVARSERHYLPLAFFGAGGGSAASRASRSALRRSRFLSNALAVFACSVNADFASPSRRALRASRSSFERGLRGSNSPGVLPISFSDLIKGLAPNSVLQRQGYNPRQQSLNRSYAENLHRTHFHVWFILPFSPISTRRLIAGERAG